MSKRRQQHKQPKTYYSQGQAVGDKHEQRRNRGESQISSERVVVVAGDAKQRYSTKWRKDGFSDLIERVTELDEDGVRVSNNELFHYVRLEHSENRRGDFSRFITENYDNLNMS